MNYCTRCGKPLSTHGLVCDLPLIRSVPIGVIGSGAPAALPCSECSALRAQLAIARSALEAARPFVKFRSADGSTEADAALHLIALALAPPAP